MDDFIAKCTIPDEDIIEEHTEISKDELAPFSRPWILHVDGSATTSMSGAGIILTNPEQMMFEYVLRFAFSASNNEAEYEALIAGLMPAKEMGTRRLNIKSDSQLVVNQVRGGYQAKDTKMASYLEHVDELRKEFLELNFFHVGREENSQADALANLGSAMEASGTSTIPLVVVR